MGLSKSYRFSWFDNKYHKTLLLCPEEINFVAQTFASGDFLIFQLESGYALLRILAKTENDGDAVWHLAAYEQLFLDVDSAEAAIANIGGLTVSHAHLALTNRAFESTQVAKLVNVELTDAEKAGFNLWKADPESEISDRSVRLLLGLR